MKSKTNQPMKTYTKKEVLEAVEKEITASDLGLPSNQTNP